jgi:hypothetical protein
MSKKSDSYYFDCFTECAGYSCRAAELLCDILTHYSPETIEEEMKKMHHIEHLADHAKHEMVNNLVKAFITPIERDDILELSSKIDDVTDAIEDVVIHMNITQVASVRQEAVAFAELLKSCCYAMRGLLEEFKNFKKSKEISERIIELNHLEEEGDEMYIRIMKDLHKNTSDVLPILIWREIYTRFEDACDTCEDVGNIIEGIIIGNT